MKRQWVLLMLSLFLSACSREPALKNAHYVTVEPQSASNTLFFTGTISPLSLQVIPSPVDGVVIDTAFQYGDVVKAGAPLFTLSSGKFLSDYRSAILDYVKAKNDFEQNKTQLSETEFLHKNLLISDDDYHSKKSSYYASQLAYMQAKDSLTVFIQQMNMKDVNILNLSIADIDKITQAMHIQSSTDNMVVSAPATGTILSPIKSDQDNSKQINKGDVVKQGDVLAVIGDLSGVSLSFKVNELTINQMNVGQPVIITGIAFPDSTLQGKVSRVDKQGLSSNGGLPTFNVQVSAQLTPAQQKVIHVGMSANVQMNLTDPPSITIPITAITETNAQTFVTLYDDISKKLKQVPVETGKTSETSVMITNGLKAGDRLVVPD